MSANTCPATSCPSIAPVVFRRARALALVILACGVALAPSRDAFADPLVPVLAQAEPPKRTKLKNRPQSEPQPQPSTQPATQPTSQPGSNQPGSNPSGANAPANGAADASLAGDGSCHADRPSAWTIVLATFRGDDRRQEASALVSRLRALEPVRDAIACDRGDATLAIVGAFEGPDDARVADALARVRAVELDAAKPFAGAFLAPPLNKSEPGSMPQYNLALAAKSFPKEAIYTLQVGVYGRNDVDRATEQDLAEARKAAEVAAFRLRQEGEQAFYYHGPRLSMVTIGVFDLTDFDPQAPSFKSPRLAALKKRFPYNLFNGQAIREKFKGDPEGRLQPSNLVALPKK